PPLEHRGEVAGMDGGLPAPPGGLLLGQARVVLPSLVDELVRTVGESAERQHRDRVDDPAELRVCCRRCRGIAFRRASTHRRGLAGAMPEIVSWGNPCRHVLLGRWEHGISVPTEISLRPAAGYAHVCYCLGPRGAPDDSPHRRG